MPNYPSDRKYTKDHEWARAEGDLVRVGITAHAVDQLGDVTLVDLKPVGQVLDAHGHFGDIESVKAVSELFSPLKGEVVEVNDALQDHPEQVNDDPYEAGWMITLRPAALADFEDLMDANAYEQFVATAG